MFKLRRGRDIDHRAAAEPQGTDVQQQLTSFAAPSSAHLYPLRSDSFQNLRSFYFLCSAFLVPIHHHCWLSGEALRLGELSFWCVCVRTRYWSRFAARQPNLLRAPAPTFESHSGSVFACAGSDDPLFVARGRWISISPDGARRDAVLYRCVYT